MNIVAKNVSLLILTSCCFISIPAIGADANTPINIRTNVNMDLFNVQYFYLTGVSATIETIQNYGIIEKAVCLPASGLTFVNMKDAINALDPSLFPDTNDGGVVYIYSALAAKYPC